MKVTAIVQARMGSERLPGKVMLEVLNKPLISWQLERIKQAKKIDQIILATTTHSQDQPLVDLAKKLNVIPFQGSIDDVLARYYKASVASHAKTIVRLTGDCPLIAPEIIDQVIDYYEQHTFDYVSNTLIRTFPRGMDTEVFSFDALKKAYINAATPYQREHVTAYFYQNKSSFKCGNVPHDPSLSNVRLTVDTKEDYLLIRKILETFKNTTFTFDELIFLLQQNPEWKKINAHVQQKAG